MNKKHLSQFRKEFLTGHGSALVTLHSCTNPAPFFDSILYGCLHNTTYDMQCEGDRGWYLHQGAKLSENPSAIEEAVCKKFLHKTDDIWTFQQLLSIVYHFAADGSKKAKSALYQQYKALLTQLSQIDNAENVETCPTNDMFDWLCVKLVELDGWNGFKKIVDDSSNLLLPKSVSFFFPAETHHFAQKKFGKARVLSQWSKQSAIYPSLLNHLEKRKEWSKPKQQEPFDVALSRVREAVSKGGYGRGWSIQVVRNGTGKEIEILAQTAINEPDPKLQGELLWGFRIKKVYDFPLEFLQQLCNSDSDILKTIGYDLLGQNPSQKTREIAHSLLKSEHSKDIALGISLLTKDLLPSDEELLFQSVRSFASDKKSDMHRIHWDAGFGIANMKGKPSTDILLYLYNSTLCGICRGRFLQIMDKKDVLSNKVLQESRFDANCETRAFSYKLMQKSLF